MAQGCRRCLPTKCCLLATQSALPCNLLETEIGTAFSTGPTGSTFGGPKGSSFGGPKGSPFGGPKGSPPAGRGRGVWAWRNPSRLRVVRAGNRIATRQSDAPRRPRPPRSCTASLAAPRRPQSSSARKPSVTNGVRLRLRAGAARAHTQGWRSPLLSPSVGSMDLGGGDEHARTRTHTRTHAHARTHTHTRSHGTSAAACRRTWEEETSSSPSGLKETE